MITYQFINALSDAKPNSHLIARADSSLLPENALIAEMRQQSTVADTRFGCAPFARITLLPDALWHDALTEGLLTALRPLLAAPASTELVLDVTDIDDVVLAQVLRFLFNQAHRLSDLKLKKTDEALRLTCITALCLPEQQAKLETAFRQQQAIAHGMVAARRLADMPSDRCTPQFVVEEAQKLCAASPALRCAAKCWMKRKLLSRDLDCCMPLAKGRPARRACWLFTITACLMARCAATWEKALPLTPAACG